MATAKQKTETGGDVVDASKYHHHKAGDLTELIDASLDNRVQTGSGAPNRKPRSILILFIISLGLIIFSFLTYIKMLNVQESIDLYNPDLSYDQLVAAGREIARSSAIWFYFFVTSLVFAAVFLGAALAVMFFRTYR